MIPRSALRHGGQRDHRSSRSHIAFTGSDQTFIEQLVESQAGIGMNVIAVESSQAVDRDGVGVVLLEDSLLSQVHGRAGFERRARHTLDLLCGLLPLVGDLPALIFVSRLPGRIEFLKLHAHDINAHFLLESPARGRPTLVPPPQSGILSCGAGTPQATTPPACPPGNLRYPLVAVRSRRTRFVAATKSCAEPPFLSTAKHFTAST